jgi:integrase
LISTASISRKPKPTETVPCRWSRSCGKLYRKLRDSAEEAEYVFVNPDKTRYTDVKKSFSAACREASVTDFTFHDLRHTFGTRLADAGVDLVKIKALMGPASIVTTMRYIHATDHGKRGAITVLSEYRQQHCCKFVTNEKQQILQPAANR